MKIVDFAPLRQRVQVDLYFWLKALLLAVAAIQFTRLLWVIVTPVGPFADWRPATPRTLSAEAQVAVLSALDPFFRTGAAAVQQAAAPATDLQLFGTREGGGNVPGSAILGQTGGEQKSYVVGEEVAPGMKLASVAFDHVELERGGVRQSLYMPGGEGSAAAPAVGTGSTASIADAFEFKPRTSGDGEISGVFVRPGRNSVPFKASGLRPGDVIIAVNGARITSLLDIQQLQAGLAPGARLILTVERGAQTIPIPLNLPANR